jgi:predicted Zn-dependent protease
MCPSSSRALRLLALVLALVAVGTGCAAPVLSVEDERKIGDKIGAELLKEPRVMRDGLVRSYVENLGKRILDAAGPQPFDYSFYVVNDPNINAAATYGGHVMVNTGLIMAADNMSELAGVLGHEIGHVALRHMARDHYRRMGTGVAAAVARIAAGMFVGYGAGMATDLLAVSYLNKYTRDHEREADQFAVHVLRVAGIDPLGIATMFETLKEQGGPNPPAFLATHPAPAERIEDTRRLIAQLDIGGKLEVDDDGRLEIIQRRIELLTGH